MIAIEQLEFSYGRKGFRLCVPALTIDRGTTAAVIGPSGSGKTTLLNLVAGVTVPDTGSVCIGDVDVTRLGEAARRAFRITNMTGVPGVRTAGLPARHR